jgi:hypothetical protein
MEMNQEWITQFNRKCAEFLGWKETTDEFKIEWTGCKTKDRLDRMNKNYIPILEKNGDVLFPDFSVMDFTKDWNCIMEVKKKICNLPLIDEFNTSYDAVAKGWACSILPAYKNSFDLIYSQVFENEIEAHLAVINKFIDWYNKQKEI